MVISRDEFVEQYLAAESGRPMTIERHVDTPSGLDAAGMMEALTDTRLGRLGIQLMADFMAPEGSRYYDAIFGSYFGQAAIRAWLVPAMAEIEFIDFTPTQPAVLLDDGEGGTSLDEWQMVANFGDQQIPLSRGCSVRRYRDGWITWACDVYDTGPFRQPPPPEMVAAVTDPDAPAPAPLPPVPVVEWPTDGAAPLAASSPEAIALMCAEFHPTESVYHDPLFGEVRGREAITAWLTDVMPKIGRVAFDPIGPALDDGTTFVQEWVQVAVVSDTERVPMARGTSVRRRVDGQIVYAADYFDTASFLDPAVQAAGVAAGSTITAADIERHRRIPT